LLFPAAGNRTAPRRYEYWLEALNIQQGMEGHPVYEAFLLIVVPVIIYNLFAAENLTFFMFDWTLQKIAVHTVLAMH
jgi:hypothetical protein